MFKIFFFYAVLAQKRASFKAGFRANTPSKEILHSDMVVNLYFVVGLTANPSLLSYVLISLHLWFIFIILHTINTQSFKHHLQFDQVFNK